jgi:hypothetical protein
MNRLLCVLTLLLLSACASNEQPPEGAPPPPLVEFKALEVLETYDRLAALKGFNAEDQARIRAQLERELATDAYKSLLIAPGVQVVGVYDSASGGFLIKGQAGDGLLSYGPTGAVQAVKVSGRSVGVVAGTRVSRGAFLVTGLLREAHLADSYRMSIGDLAGGKDESRGKAHPKTAGRTHDLHLFGVVVGLSADLGTASFSLDVEAPQPAGEK